jgi:hypothetical protein
MVQNMIQQLGKSPEVRPGTESCARVELALSLHKQNKQTTLNCAPPDGTNGDGLYAAPGPGNAGAGDCEQGGGDGGAGDAEPPDPANDAAGRRYERLASNFLFWVGVFLLCYNIIALVQTWDR